MKDNPNLEGVKDSLLQLPKKTEKMEAGEEEERESSKVFVNDDDDSEDDYEYYPDLDVEESDKEAESVEKVGGVTLNFSLRCLRLHIRAWK